MLEFRRQAHALIASLVVLALAACGESVAEKVAGAKNRHDGPAIWTASDTDSTLYILGSMHLIPANSDWQRNDLRAAMDDSGTIFFESIMSKEDEIDIGALQIELGRYNDGTGLTEYLSGPSLNRLTAAEHNFELPAGTMLDFKAWLASDLLVQAAAQKAGFDTANSPDVVLLAKARAQKKIVKGLEPARTYIDLISAQDDDAQKRALEALLTDIDGLSGAFKQIYDAWLIGDLKALNRLLAVPAQAQDPQIYDALYTRRNRLWTEELAKFMDGDVNALVVVGTGHMLGENNLLDMLEAEGMQIERYRRFDLPNDKG